MGPDVVIEFILDNLDKVVIVGTTFAFVSWINEVVTDYSGTRVHPGMEPLPKAWDNCDCPSCYDPKAPKRSDYEMSFEDWEKMVLSEIERTRGSEKQAPK